MENPRERWDTLWELMNASALLGRESERLPDQPTTEQYQKAYEWRRQALAKAMDLFEVFPKEKG
jgi:hypothetical protein